ncbi:hypothetical protein DMENIID0001_108890 [Sergentomyia squamirostris]
MCNVPPKFYQVCRLCLTVVSDNELIELSVYPSWRKGGGGRSHRLRDDISPPARQNDVTASTSPKDNGDDDADEEATQNSENDSSKKWWNHKTPRIKAKASDDTSTIEDGGDVKEIKVEEEEQDVVTRKTVVDATNNRDHRDVDVTKDKKENHLTNGGSHDIPDRIFQCLSITITPADELPNVVCRKCREQLDICHRFREMAHKSQKSLENFLQLTTTFEGSPQVSYQVNDSLSV